MRVLIACEESQAVCKAFRAKGHMAYSCDILPTRGNPDYHIKGDIVTLLKAHRDKYWDLTILHPDCTKMAVSGNRWYGSGSLRHNERLEAVRWTKSLWQLAKYKSKSACLENPVSVIFSELGYDSLQYIQPWMFGHGETKKQVWHYSTCQNLSQLISLKAVSIGYGKCHQGQIAKETGARLSRA